MAVGSLSQLSALFKDRFLDLVFAAVKSSATVVFLNDSKRGVLNYTGKTYMVPVITNFAGSAIIGYSDTASGITGSASTTVDLSFTPKALYTAASLNQTAMDMSLQGGLGPDKLNSIMEVEVQSLKARFMTGLNKMVLLGGPGKFILNQHKSEASGATWQATGDFEGAQAMLTAAGGNINCTLINLQDYSTISTEAISAVSESAGTITLAGGADTTSVPDGYGIGVVLTDTSLATDKAASLAAEADGLLSSCAVQTYGGESRATTANAVLRPTVMTVATSGTHAKTTLTLDAINRLKSTLEQNSNDDAKPNVMFIREGSAHLLNALVQGNIYNTGFVPSSADPEEELSPRVFAGMYDGVRVIKDKSLPKGVILFACDTKFHIVSGPDGDAHPKVREWREVPNGNTYECAATYTYAIVCSSPQSIGALVGFTA